MRDMPTLARRRRGRTNRWTSPLRTWIPSPGGGGGGGRGSWRGLRRKRVFILGPSHHVYFDHCALSEFEYYATPLGNLAVDRETLLEIEGCGEKFGWMHAETDEGEHSIEMHLPYIYKMLDLAGKADSAKVVPILVGAIATQKEKLYGRVLAKYLKDPENVFVISSDFCHW